MEAIEEILLLYAKERYFFSFLHVYVGCRANERSVFVELQAESAEKG
ncbi:hypothetical protein ABU16_2336 [Bacillus subtilis]|nr:hypothetical protein ABU16_2336 [Bacillus subtilis]